MTNSDLTDETVVLRQPVSTLLLSLVAIPVFVVCWLLLRSGRPNQSFVLADIVLVAAVLGILVRVVFLARARVVLHPDRLEILNLRREELPWSGITAVELVPGRAANGARVQVRDGSGVHHLLALRGVGTFDTKHVRVGTETVHRWWLAHGGAQPTDVRR